MRMLRNNDAPTCPIKMERPLETTKAGVGISFLQLMVSPFSRLRLRCSIMLATPRPLIDPPGVSILGKALSKLAGIAPRAIALMGERPSRDRDDLLYRNWRRRMSASHDSLVRFSGESPLSE